MQPTKHGRKMTGRNTKTPQEQGGMQWSFQFLNAGDIKLIAIITMTIDHIGAALLPQYLFLRMIGRVAFPIYCYMIVNGLFHTRSRLKYLGRQLLFAVVAEVCFNLAFWREIKHPENQNVFFTLAIGLSVISLIDLLKEHWNRWQGSTVMGFFLWPLELMILFAGCLIADQLRTDYSFYGILMIFGFYAFRMNAIVSCAFQIYINWFLIGGVQAYAIAALPVIWLYNGEKGRLEEKGKWVFYWYYPVHLLIIYCVEYFVQ